MALKFLNKKGWHTGSLRNIENVWKAEQKHDAEQKKLEELRKQIHEERERSEFRLLQEQAGLVPRQERLDFLYESGLAVGKSSEGFKALAAPPSGPPPPPSEPSSSKAAVPGALFEKDKPQSANDAWRKLHSDPLLLIRQREKEALDRIKNNPVKMAMIKKSVEDEKEHDQDKKDKQEKKERKRKHKSKHDYRSSKVSSDSEERSEDERETRKREHAKSEPHRHKSKREKKLSDVRSDSEDASKGERSKRDRLKHSGRARSDLKHTGGVEDYRRKGNHSKSDHHGEERRKSDHSALELGLENKRNGTQSQDMRPGYGYNRPRGVPKLSEEERAACLREMQVDAELHEEQRWKRLKKAAEADAREEIRASASGGKNFLDDAQKSIYGTEKGGSSTIEESVRRRTYFSQGGSASHESNAFRR